MTETLITMLQSINLNCIADIYFDEEKKAEKKRDSYRDFIIPRKTTCVSRWM